MLTFTLINGTSRKRAFSCRNRCVSVMPYSKLGATQRHQPLPNAAHSRLRMMAHWGMPLLARNHRSVRNAQVRADSGAVSCPDQADLAHPLPGRR